MVEIKFGDDGLLYITTGDGWEGDFAGDAVQSLSTMNGKVLRI
ncbi:MAG: PQQ-dependent sugar dehydrogenase [Acidiferrobacterales bacterium]|nr:PQQ-dependent sugar dehydrogenase [Acidiferrobacterales bacterium]